jgi:ABC-type nitrate/sulfonate/bicarbonate transport system substrate-binding protein
VQTGGAVRRLLGMLLVSAVLTAGASVAHAQTRTTVRVAYIPVVTWLPFLVAKDRGFFERNGIDLAMTRFPNIVNLPQALGKQFDIVPTTAPDFLNAVGSGLNLAAVAGESIETSANKSFLLMVRSDGSVNTLRDLEGKRVASPGIGSVMHVALLHAIRKEGGDPSKVIGVEVPFPAMADQLRAGRVDAVEQLEPFAGQMLQRGFKSLGAPLLSIADPVLFPFWIADAEWAKANRAVIRRWVASLEEGLAFIRSDEKEARAILARHSGLPETVVAGVPLPVYDFRITPAQLDLWRNVLVTQGRPLSGLDMNRLVVSGD